MDHPLDEIIRLAYPELRQIAARLMSRERPDHTLQSTALVNESLIRLLDLPAGIHLTERDLLQLAAHRMRRILVDYGRRFRSDKRGGGIPHEPPERAAGLDVDREELLGLDLCLERLGQLDPRSLKVVELRFFAGLTAGEAAEVLGVSTATVNRDWEFARAWLHRALRHAA